MDLAGTERSITDHAGLLVSIKGLDTIAIGPYSVEYNCIVR